MTTKTELETLGRHEGFWISGPRIRQEFRIASEGELVRPSKITEDMYLERSGLIFRVFLDDFRKDRYFLEVVS